MQSLDNSQELSIDVIKPSESELYARLAVLMKRRDKLETMIDEIRYQLKLGIE